MQIRFFLFYLSEPTNIKYLSKNFQTEQEQIYYSSNPLAK